MIFEVPNGLRLFSVPTSRAATLSSNKRRQTGARACSGPSLRHPRFITTTRSTTSSFGIFSRWQCSRCQTSPRTVFCCKELFLGWYLGRNKSRTGLSASYLGKWFCLECVPVVAPSCVHAEMLKVIARAHLHRDLPPAGVTRLVARLVS